MVKFKKGDVIIVTKDSQASPPDYKIGDISVVDDFDSAIPNVDPPWPGGHTCIVQANAELLSSIPLSDICVLVNNFEELRDIHPKFLPVAYSYPSRIAIDSEVFAIRKYVISYENWVKYLKLVKKEETGPVTYTSYNQLQGNTLKYNDKLVFSVNNHNLDYNVSQNHLCSYKHDNDKIFLELGITDKYDFCSRIYGYSSRGGGFPVYKDDDFNAATKIALELFRLCESKSTKPVEPTKYYVEFDGTNGKAVKEWLNANGAQKESSLCSRIYFWVDKTKSYSYDHSNNIPEGYVKYDLSKKQVKSEWWENIQKGDYVVCISGASMIPSDYIYQLNHNDWYNDGIITDIFGTLNGWSGEGNHTHFRPATIEESELCKKNDNKPTPLDWKPKNSCPITNLDDYEWDTSLGYNSCDLKSVCGVPDSGSCRHVKWCEFAKTSTCGGYKLKPKKPVSMTPEIAPITKVSQWAKVHNYKIVKSDEGCTACAISSYNNPKIISCNNITGLGNRSCDIGDAILQKETSVVETSQSEEEPNSTLVKTSAVKIDYFSRKEEKDPSELALSLEVRKVKKVNY